jgi:hypothetical protein
MEMQDPPPKEPKDNEKKEKKEKEWLAIALKWMKPGATVAVPLSAEPLRLPRNVTLAQLRAAILESPTTTTNTDFQNLVVHQKFQMHFVYKGAIWKEEKDDKDDDSSPPPSLLELCQNVPPSNNDTITLFVVLSSNPPPPPQPPAERLPVQRPLVTEQPAAAVPLLPAAPPRRERRTEPPSQLLPAPFLEELQQQFPEHDIRDLVSTLLSHPDARAQMERSFDLQLAQLDHVPGGMSLLHSLYTQQQDQEERLLWAHPAAEEENGPAWNDAALASANGQAMPNPWGNHHPRRTTRPTSSSFRAMRPTTRRPNPWLHHDDSATEELYTAATTASVATTDNPWSSSSEEQLLVDMGFTNRARNRALLRQHDWDTTVDILLQEQEAAGGASAEDDPAE